MEWKTREHIKARSSQYLFVCLFCFVFFRVIFLPFKSVNNVKFQQVEINVQNIKLRTLLYSVRTLRIRFCVLLYFLQLHDNHYFVQIRKYVFSCDFFFSFDVKIINLMLRKKMTEREIEGEWRKMLTFCTESHQKRSDHSSKYTTHSAFWKKRAQTTLTKFESTRSIKKTATWGRAEK